MAAPKKSAVLTFAFPPRVSLSTTITALLGRLSDQPEPPGHRSGDMPNLVGWLHISMVAFVPFRNGPLLTATVLP